MTTLKVRFDGQVLVPETPVDLPRDRVFEISVLETETPTSPTSNGASPESPASPLAGLDELLTDLSFDPDTPTDLAMRGGRSALADWAEQLPADPDAPTDGAAQHDHYLYGRPKRP